tara:strand:+ start:589 stop:1644 length:1056 start_codon:yes stop_codon:yes gene_type:complete
MSKYKEVKIPYLNPNDTRCKIIKIKKNNNEHINKNDVLFEVETDKVLSDITSEYEGFFFTEVEVENFYEFGETIAQIFENQDQIKKMIPKLNKLNKDDIDQDDLKKFFSKSAYEKAIELKINPNILIEEIDTFITTDILDKYLSVDNSEIQADLNTFNTLQLSRKLNIDTSISFDFTSSVNPNFQKKTPLNIYFIDILISNLNLSFKSFDKICTLKSKNNFYLNDFKPGLIIKENDYLYNINLGKTDKNFEKAYKNRVDLTMDFLKNGYSEKFTGSTISLSFIDNEYIKSHVPIIYKNQSVILGIAYNSNKFKNNIINFNITVSYDHQILDGDYINSFIKMTFDNLKIQLR